MFSLYVQGNSTNEHTGRTILHIIFRILVATQHTFLFHKTKMHFTHLYYRRIYALTMNIQKYTRCDALQ